MMKVWTQTAGGIGLREREDERARVLGELARSCSERALRIAMDLLRNRAEAEDAVQEALARSCESLERVREPAALPAWFFRVLTRVCLRKLRRRRLGRLVHGWWQRDRTSTVDPGDLSRREEVAALLFGLEELPPRQRAAVVLRYGHEMPVAEVARMLGVGPETVKTHLARGLRRLRQSLGRRLGDER